MCSATNTPCVVKPEHVGGGTLFTVGQFVTSFVSTQPSVITHRV